MLTDAEAALWQRLAAWWLAWTPPPEPYDLGPVRVLDPARSHAWHAARIAEGCTGQVQRATFDWLRRHAAGFGGPT